MTERELLAVLSAIMFEGSNDTPIAAVQRASHILNRVDEAIAAMPAPMPSPHQMSGLAEPPPAETGGGPAPYPRTEEEHQTHKKRGK